MKLLLPFSVGAKRLELSTPCTPCKCASQLRHTPNNLSCFISLHLVISSFEIGCKSTTFFVTDQIFFKIFFNHLFISTVRRDVPEALLHPSRPIQPLSTSILTVGGTNG